MVSFVCQNNRVESAHWVSLSGKSKYDRGVRSSGSAWLTRSHACCPRRNRSSFHCSHLPRTSPPPPPFFVQVIPGSDLLRVAQADLEERRGRIEEADAAWKAFLKDRRSTTGHIMYLRSGSILTVFFLCLFPVKFSSGSLLSFFRQTSSSFLFCFFVRSLYVFDRARRVFPVSCYFSIDLVLLVFLVRSVLSGSVSGTAIHPPRNETASEHQVSYVL